MRFWKLCLLQMVNYKGSCTWYNKLPLTNNWFVSYFPNMFIRKASLWLWNFTLIFKVILLGKTKASRKDNSTLKTKADIFRHPCKGINKHLGDWTKSGHTIPTSVFQGKWHLSEVQCVCCPFQYQTSTSSEMPHFCLLSLRIALPHPHDNCKQTFQYHGS